MKREGFKRIAAVAFALALTLSIFASSTPAQSRRPARGLDAGRLINISLREVTLQSIDFRDQTARMNLALEITNALLPLSLKDFDYRLRLYGLDTIEGSYDGVMKLGGRNGSRVNLP
ncbi:MAG TPA: hypothetical protein VNN73_17080, partial [Blastocatellia bacterium]|nr:hypothetical protein [Blastocatellia bacterium]